MSLSNLSCSSRRGELRDAPTRYLRPRILVVDEVGYLAYGDDAANVLFHVVNERHIKKRARQRDGSDVFPSKAVWPHEALARNACAGARFRARQTASAPDRRSRVRADDEGAHQPDGAGISRNKEEIGPAGADHRRHDQPAGLIDQLDDAASCDATGLSPAWRAVRGTSATPPLGSEWSWSASRWVDVLVLDGAGGRRGASKGAKADGCPAAA